MFAAAAAADAAALRADAASFCARASALLFFSCSSKRSFCESTAPAREDLDISIESSRCSRLHAKYYAAEFAGPANAAKQASLEQKLMRKKKDAGSGHLDANVVLLDGTAFVVAMLSHLCVCSW